MAKTKHIVVKFNLLPTIRKKIADKEINELLTAFAQEGRNIVVRSMLQSPATGRKYDRGGRTHVASSPGNPPRIDTGELVNSITPRKVKPGQVKVSTSVDYAHGLEFGETRVAPRPFMGPMAKKLEKLMPTIAKGYYEYKGFLK